MKKKYIGKVRPYFSIQHIRAAALFTRKAKVFEMEYTALDNFQNKIMYTGNNQSEQRAYITSSIFHSVAFLEASINELFSDAYDNFIGKLKDLNKNTITLMARMWNRGIPRTAKYNILEKYNIALDMADKKTLDCSSNPYQDCSIIIKLRNSLIHYEPEWFYLPDRHGVFPDTEKKLLKELKNKFQLNLIFPPGNPYYPDRILGYGCAEWCVKASIDLYLKFFEKLGIKPYYDLNRKDL